MIFSSSLFLVYFLPVFLAIYFIAQPKHRNATLLIASILFYSWGAPLFIFVILGTTTLDFYLVRLLSAAQALRSKRLFLILSLSLNVGLLFYFKYCNFFVENMNAILASFGAKEVEWTKVVLPIGISFYTFESITYVVDVYRGLHKPLRNFWQYQMYILLFPKLIAGPIIRYHEISDQIEDRSANDTLDNKISGFVRFATGLAKKVLVANVLAAQADEIFKIPVAEISSSMAWIGMLAYTFQIYFDFSGYSDMAIGIGRMIGFKFPENFDNPYISGSITEFWRRWHMTLGNWMKNYLYIPLGGNRVNSNFKLYFNLWLVFLASGLWHGAAWTFIFWGVYHGFFLIIERMFLLNVYKKTGKLPAILLTFLFVAIGWVFFRAETFGEAWTFVGKLFSSKTTGIHFYPDMKFRVVLCLAVFFSLFVLIPGGKAIQQKFYFPGEIKPALSLPFILCGLMLFAISLASISSSSFNPFIYFRF
ncbi:MAG: rane bound O-acyl transferase family protein [Bacteroidetes bacterium]|nr:rane bound O-acyl transferase family protein [Bacteroidota bacterium]